jgi:cellulose synthase/poly-beta-1,6-N-acetylglucosamine synthase-like glycosyltransferase
MEWGLIFVDRLLFILMAISVAYLAIFAFFSLWGLKKKYPASTKKFNFLILIPAYKEDRVIMESVNSILNQEYPKDKFDLVVISDKMEEDTNRVLSALPLTLLELNAQNSSKALALNFAMDNLPNENYNIVVILDADNVVEPNFLNELNDCYFSGSLAMQAHRLPKNLDTDVAIMDAISEEINNSIFRRGHVNMGLSSALIGSGMAFDFKLFRKNVVHLKTAGEDKELEVLLFKERVFIDYLDNVKVFDQKTQKTGGFYNQRRRWLAAQFLSFAKGIKDIPGALLSLNIDYADKIFQWALLPRVLILGLISIFASALTIFSWTYSIKWWLLLIVLVFTFAMAIPDYLVTKRSLKALRKLPILFILMFFNIFRTRGASKNFIHTQKG